MRCLDLTKVDQVSETYWRLRELQERSRDDSGIEVYRSLEYPHESANWVVRSAEPQPRIRRRSRIRRILEWVGREDGVSAGQADR
jgi:hypothetical protein